MILHQAFPISVVSISPNEIFSADIQPWGAQACLHRFQSIVSTWPRRNSQGLYEAQATVVRVHSPEPPDPEIEHLGEVQISTQGGLSMDYVTVGRRRGRPSESDDPPVWHRTFTSSAIWENHNARLTIPPHVHRHQVYLRQRHAPRNGA